MTTNYGIEMNNEKEIEEARRIIGISTKYDITVLLNHYFVGYMVLVENEETKHCRTLTEAKCILIRQEILMMVKEKGHFDIKGKIPFDDICLKCHGLGEIFKFLRTAKTVTCRECSSSKEPGKMICKACNGTKKYHNRECFKCEGTGSRVCYSCGGKRTVKINAIFHQFEKKPDHCHICKGRGFIIPEIVEVPARIVRVPDNPVISASMGKEIAKTINP